ncbi:Cna B-type domain-containing protein, partial [Oscillibacter sp.]|uniref:Cna B-type domain-containing protein n=1 Tax=Oscillibacter sp. TaxID=1945593 RepID=UPI0028A9769A
DSGGNATVTLNQEGTYLILGDSLSASSGTYSFSPSLVTLPDSNKKMATTATVKVSYQPSPPSNPPGRAPINVTVLKIWNDDDEGEFRPHSIMVSLLRDDRVFYTVRLSQSNNWRYTWNNLSTGYTWSVIEDTVPHDYTVSYSQEGTIFTITNTYTTNIAPPKPPKTDEPTMTDLPPEPIFLASLPQTGLLQWPIPIMAVLGIMLFSRGWWEHFKRQTHEN